MQLLNLSQRRVFAAALLFAAWPVAHVQPAEAPEHKIKAAYIFNFARFVEWPQTAFPTPESPVVIGVIGRDTVSAYLPQALANQTVAGRPVVVKAVHPEQEVKDAHILYIALSERDDVDRAVLCGSAAPTLTVSQIPNFLSKGGMVQLSVDKGQVIFRLNNQTLASAGLTASSQMLQYAAPERK